VETHLFTYEKEFLHKKMIITVAPGEVNKVAGWKEELLYFFFGTF
jgi:hypothetical protein